MKLSDIPPHVTDINPPWFFQKVYSEGNQDDVIPLFHNHYYDGPLSGYFKHQDRYFFAKAIYPEDRKYWASWELTEEEKKAALDRHDLFCKYVGEHTSYFLDENENWSRNLEKVQPPDMWDGFYKNPNVPTVDIESIENREIFGILLNPFKSW
jgi:hypothetical protein